MKSIITLLITTFVISFSVCVAQQKLVLHCPFNGSMLSVVESSKYQISTFGDCVFSTDRFGYQSSCLDFRSGESYLKIVGMQSPRSDFSYCIWIKSYSPMVRGYQSFGHFFYEGTNICYFVNDSDSAFFVGYDQGAKLWNISVPSDVNMSEWNHVVLSYANDQRILFINGKELMRQSVRLPLPDHNTATFYIGAYDPNFDRLFQHFDGRIDDVMFFDGALSSKQVEELYSTGTITSIDQPSSIENFSISPNPIHQNAQISFETKTRSRVLVKISDILGRPVETILDDVQDPQSFRLNWSGSGHPVGLYFCTIESDKKINIVRILKQ